MCGRRNPSMCPILNQSASQIVDIFLSFFFLQPLKCPFCALLSSFMFQIKGAIATLRPWKCLWVSTSGKSQSSQQDARLKLRIFTYAELELISIEMVSGGCCREFSCCQEPSWVTLPTLMAALAPAVPCNSSLALMCNSNTDSPLDLHRKVDLFHHLISWAFVVRVQLLSSAQGN